MRPGPAEEQQDHEVRGACTGRAQHAELLTELADIEHANVTPHRKTFFEAIKEYFSPSDPPKKTEE